MEKERIDYGETAGKKVPVWKEVPLHAQEERKKQKKKTARGADWWSVKKKRRLSEKPAIFRQEPLLPHHYLNMLLFDLPLTGNLNTVVRTFFACSRMRKIAHLPFEGKKYAKVVQLQLQLLPLSPSAPVNHTQKGKQNIRLACWSQRVMTPQQKRAKELGVN